MLKGKNMLVNTLLDTKKGAQRLLIVVDYFVVTSEEAI